MYTARLAKKTYCLFIESVGTQRLTVGVRLTLDTGAEPGAIISASMPKRVQYSLHQASGTVLLRACQTMSVSVVLLTEYAEQCESSCCSSRLHRIVGTGCDPGGLQKSAHRKYAPRAKRSHCSFLSSQGFATSSRLHNKSGTAPTRVCLRWSASRERDTLPR